MNLDKELDEILTELQQKSVAWAQTGAGKNYDMVEYANEAKQDIKKLIVEARTDELENNGDTWKREEPQE